MTKIQIVVGFSDMDNSKESSKSRRVFAVVILMVAVIVFSWSAVKIVEIFPSAISSLASIADTVYDYDPKENYSIVVTSDHAIINSSETTSIWWSTTKQTGTYTFNYECQDGVAIDIASKDRGFTSVSCGNSYDLGSVDKIDLRIDSEKKRSADVTYSIAFFNKNASDSSTSQTQTISVLNSSIAENVPTEPESPAPATPTVDEKPEPHDENPVTPTKETPKPAIIKPVVTTPVYTYVLPVSNPNGNTDLAVSNLNVGFQDQAKNFIKSDTLFQNVEGVIQFTVHNIGNKTSDDWTFKAKLPNNLTYTSSIQKPLKPNERAVITLQFSAVTNLNLQNISVETQTKSDSNENNNLLTKSVVVIK